MATTARQKKQLDLVDQAKNINPDHAKNVRLLEQQLAAAKAKIKLAEAKQRLAEEELIEALEREEVLLATKDQFEDHVIKPPRRRKGGKKTATPVICWTDWHSEENIEPATVNNLNSFDLKTCDKRFERCCNRTGYLIDFYRSVADVRDAVLWLGGDLMSGTIHEELEEGNFLGPAEAVLYIQQKVYDGIRYLFDVVKLERLHVTCNYGNHSRTTKKKRVATGFKHSWEWLAYNQIADKFSDDKRVTFQIPKGKHAYVDIQGWTVRLQHGDAIRYQGGVGGISIPVNKAIAQWNKSKHADYDIFGHWHQYLNEWRWTCCGCLCGYDSFALEIKADYQPPTQTLIFFDRDLGKTAALPIFV